MAPPTGYTGLTLPALKATGIEYYDNQILAYQNLVKKKIWGLEQFDLAEAELKLAKVKTSELGQKLVAQRKHQENHLLDFNEQISIAIQFEKRLHEDEESAKAYTQQLLDGFKEMPHLLGVPLLHPIVKKSIETYSAETRKMSTYLTPFDLTKDENITKLLDSTSKIDAAVQGLKTLLRQLKAKQQPHSKNDILFCKQIEGLISEYKKTLTYVEMFFDNKKIISSYMTQLNYETSKTFNLEIKLSKARNLVQKEAHELISKIKTTYGAAQIELAKQQRIEKLNNGHDENDDPLKHNENKKSPDLKLEPTLIQQTRTTLNALQLAFGLPFKKETPASQLAHLDLADNPKKNQPSLG